MRVYEQSEKKTKGLSRGKEFDELEDECEAEWLLPRGTAFKGRKWRQEIEHQGGGEMTFLRLTFGHGHVSMVHKAFFEKIILSTPSESTKIQVLPYSQALLLSDFYETKATPTSTWPKIPRPIKIPPRPCILDSCARKLVNVFKEENGSIAEEPGLLCRDCTTWKENHHHGHRFEGG